LYCNILFSSSTFKSSIPCLNFFPIVWS
jgi:hypothetical protein